MSDTMLVATTDVPGLCVDGKLAAIDIEIGRVVGDVDILKESNQIAETTTFLMWLRDPAADVGVEVNGHALSGELTDREGNWALAYVEVPIEYINFAADPGMDGARIPAHNTITVTSGTSTGEDFACSAFAGAAMVTSPVPLPVIYLHALYPFGKPTDWNAYWKQQLTQNNVPFSRDVFLAAATAPQQAVVVAGEVAYARSRFGVQRVTLVGHSQGGRAARHYAETNMDVANVMTLGSPHAGTRLMDIMVISMLFRIKFPYLQPFYAASPAPPFASLFDMTTWWTRIYNWLHGPNPTVNYETVAGVYTHANPCPSTTIDPLCPLHPIWRRIVGQGDLMVSKTSSHGLPWQHTTHTYNSTWPDTQAFHLDMDISPLACAALMTTITSTYARLPATIMANHELGGGSLPDQEPSEPGQTDVPDGGTTVDPDVYGYTITSVLDLHNSGEMDMVDVPIDETTEETVFLIFHGEEDIAVEVISPSGAIYDAANRHPEAELVTGPVGWDSNAPIIGYMTAVIVDQPVVGTYQVRVTAGAITGPSGVDITAAIKNPTVDITAMVDRDDDADYGMSPGDGFDIFVDVSGGARQGALLLVDMLKPDQSLTQLVLADDGVSPDALAGDNRYSVRVSGAETAQVGDYALVVTADGLSAASDRFTRQTGLAITVEPGL